MNSKQSIEEAAKGFAQNVNPELYHLTLDIDWLIFKLVEFALSDAAKEYWFEQFKAYELQEQIELLTRIESQFCLVDNPIKPHISKLKEQLSQLKYEQ